MQPFEQRMQAERARIDPGEPIITMLQGQLWLGGETSATNSPTEPETAQVTQPAWDRRAKAVAGLIAIGLLTLAAIAFVVWFLWTFQPANWGG